jgi:hypothetical protein
MQEVLGAVRSGKCQPELAGCQQGRDANDWMTVAGAFGVGEQQSQGLARTFHPGLGQLPPFRPLPAMRALEIERARIPAQLEVVPPKEPAPHKSPHVPPLYLQHRVAARTFAAQTENRDTSIALCINGSQIALNNNVRIRIIRQPSGAVDGVSLRDYDMGRRYDLPSSLAQYLMAQGFAFLEMRQSARSTRWRLTDRRKDAGMFAGVRRASAWAF